MKKRKVKCPECKGLGVINKATPVFIGMYLTAYHSETHRCLHCDGKGIIYFNNRGIEVKTLKQIIILSGIVFGFASALVMFVTFLAAFFSGHYSVMLFSKKKS